MARATWKASDLICAMRKSLYTDSLAAWMSANAGPGMEATYRNKQKAVSSAASYPARCRLDGMAEALPSPSAATARQHIPAAVEGSTGKGTQS